MQKPRDEAQSLANAIEKLHREARTNDRFKLTSVTLDQLERMKAEIHTLRAWIWERTDGPPLP